MYSNTKLLVSISFLVIVLGFGFLWFGLRPESILIPSPAPSVQTLKVVSSQEATSSGIQGIDGEQAYVSDVVDGDTIKVSLGSEEKTVRFVGIDTPETVDPRRPVGCFGKEASNETKSLLAGKNIVLQKDVSDSDKYGRLLRLIFLPLNNGQTLFVNDYLVREGFAKVYTYPPDVKFNEQFKQAETEAKEFKRGMWGRC